MRSVVIAFNIVMKRVMTMTYEDFTPKPIANKSQDSDQ